MRPELLKIPIYKAATGAVIAESVGKTESELKEPKTPKLIDPGLQLFETPFLKHPQAHILA